MSGRGLTDKDEQQHTANFKSFLDSGDGQKPTIANIPKKVSLYSSLPSFKDIQEDSRPFLLICKLRQCSKFVRQEDTELRKVKHMILYQLLDYINSSNNIFPDIAVPDFFACVSANIFRATAKPACDNYTWDNDEDEPAIDNNWYHLQFIYELLLRFIFAANQHPQHSEYHKSVKKFIDTEFILKLLQLFNTSDPRERDYVKTILHRIYANFMMMRSYIRSIIKSEIMCYMNYSQRHNGICEILEILGSIINGFATPLKVEHISFMAQVLLPLHRIMYVKTILPQLSYCVSKFVEKDPTLSAGVVMGVLSYWPRLSNQKEVSFLQELEELLEAIPPEHLVTTDTSTYVRFKTITQSQSSTEEQATITSSDLKKPSSAFTKNSCPHDFVPKLPTFPTPKLDLAIFDLKPDFLQDIKKFNVYKSIFYHISQCISSSHFQVAERALNMLLNTKIANHLKFATASYQKVADSYGVVVTSKNCVFLNDYNFPYTLAKPLSFNAQNYWSQNIRAQSESLFKVLAEAYPDVCKSVDDMFFQELIAHEHLKTARRQKWDDIAKLCDKSLGGSGELSEEYLRRMNFVEQRDMIGECVDEDEELGSMQSGTSTANYLSLNAFTCGDNVHEIESCGPASQSNTELWGAETHSHEPAMLESDYPIKEMSLNPNTIPFDRLRTAFVPGYKEELVQPGNVALAMVPVDPLNRTIGCGLKAYNLTVSRLRRLVELVNEEARGGNFDKLPIKNIALRNQLLTPRSEPLATDADAKVTIAAPANSKKLASRRTATNQAPAGGVRRKSMTPLTFEVKVAKDELKNYVSPSEGISSHVESK